MLRKTLLGFVFSASFVFAGDKGQLPAAPKPQDASKGQAPAASVPAKIITQTVITREYVPVEKHRRLFFKQFGPSRIETMTCPNCQK